MYKQFDFNIVIFQSMQYLCFVLLLYVAIKLIYGGNKTVLFSGTCNSRTKKNLTFVVCRSFMIILARTTVNRGAVALTGTGKSINDIAPLKWNQIKNWPVWAYETGTFQILTCEKTEDKNLPRAKGTIIFM